MGQRVLTWPHLAILFPQTQVMSLPCNSPICWGSITQALNHNSWKCHLACFSPSCHASAVTTPQFFPPSRPARGWDWGKPFLSWVSCHSQVFLAGWRALCPFAWFSVMCTLSRTDSMSWERESSELISTWTRLHSNCCGGPGTVWQSRGPWYLQLQYVL